MKEKPIKLRNHRTVTVKITRHELCDLLLATTALSDQGKKWGELHDKLRAQLNAFDAKLDEEENT